MKRLILGSLSLLLISTTAAPAVQAHTRALVLGTPSRTNVNPCSLIARRTLGTPFHPAANPAADPGSRLDVDTPGVPNISVRRDKTKSAPC